MVWFSQNLRLADNEALAQATATHDIVVPVFLWAPDEEIPWSPGSASRWWLNRSLTALNEAMRQRGSRLIVRRGPSKKSLLKLIEEAGADSVFWTRRYEPAVLPRDRLLQKHLEVARIGVHVCSGSVLFEPETICNKAGKPFQVFGAFKRACLAMPEQGVSLRAPKHIPPPNSWPQSLSIADLDLEPKIDWASGLRKMWTPGEKGARRQLRAFLKQPIATYPTDRDRPDRAGTSRLSPHLHFGEISPRQIWHAIRKSQRPESDAYRTQILWREFSYHLLFNFPQTPLDPLRPEFRFFPWKFDEAAFKAWIRGKTGYPLVDAGMRELWHTGWMHNRVRMMVASFLVKHLLIAWQEGARWFWDTLVDADLANNTMGWQWTAGCGADAAPYFRIFNPVIQGRKFDPSGEYVRRWIPELANVPSKWIHEPWRVSEELSPDYPAPIVDHEIARQRALAALQRNRRRLM